MIPSSNPDVGSARNPSVAESIVRRLTPSGSPNARLPEARRSIVVDMSPEAIEQRLREYFQLWTFWTKLRRFQKVQPDSATTSSQSVSSPDSATE